MPPSATTPDISEMVEVRADADAVWVAVADPEQTAQWSPEATGIRAEGGVTGPLPVGTRFAGSNRHGRFAWSTSCVVVESTPGTAFAFDVRYGPFAVSRWRYAVTALDDGCRVEEQWWDRRGRTMTLLSGVGTGVHDRASHNRASMRATLDALKFALETTHEGDG